MFGTYFGPTIRALETLDADAQRQFWTDLGEVFARYNRATDGTAIVQNRYCQTVATRL